MILLELKELTKEFKDIRAVDKVSLAIKKGEILGLLGPNGAGKSTIISLISTLNKPDSGEIIYAGENIFKKPQKIQQKMGVVPQEIALYPSLSGFENLKFWGNVYGLSGKKLQQRIEEVTEIIGIRERLSQKLETYSGGMKRRINIGAALLHQPELLIMDEPTVGIDPQSRKHILNTVKTLKNNGMTVIYTSHYMEEVEYLCDEISIIDKGKVIASGTKEEIIGIIQGQQRISLKLEKITIELLDKLSEIKSVVNVKEQKDEIILTSDTDKGIIKEIINITSEAKSEILGIDIEKPNLEAVFLHLTGRALRD